MSQPPPTPGSAQPSPPSGKANTSASSESRPKSLLSSRSSTSTSTTSSVTDQLDRLTTAVQQVGETLQACKQDSDERHAAYLSRTDDEKKRGQGMQAQLAQLLAMTQESLRQEKEEPLKVPGSETFARDLRRAAFGTGGDAESASRSSMLESSRDSVMTISDLEVGTHATDGS